MSSQSRYGAIDEPVNFEGLYLLKGLPLDRQLVMI